MDTTSAISPPAVTAVGPHSQLIADLAELWTQAMHVVNAERSPQAVDAATRVASLRLDVIRA